MRRYIETLSTKKYLPLLKNFAEAASYEEALGCHREWVEENNLDQLNQHKQEGQELTIDELDICDVNQLVIDRIIGSSEIYDNFTAAHSAMLREQEENARILADRYERELLRERQLEDVKLNQEPLLEAFKQNNLIAVKEAFDGGAVIGPGVRIGTYRTPSALFEAIDSKVSYEIFEFLLNNGAEIINPLSLGEFSLDEYQVYGSLHHLLYELEEQLGSKLVELFISKGAKIIPDSDEVDNCSTLEYVVSKGSVNLVTFFLKEHLDGIDKNNTKYTNIALTRSDPEILNLLLKTGMVIDDRTENIREHRAHEENMFTGIRVSRNTYTNDRGESGGEITTVSNSLGRLQIFYTEDLDAERINHNRKIDLLLCHGAIPEKLSDLHYAKQSIITRRNNLRFAEKLGEIISTSRILFFHFSHNINMTELGVIHNIMNNLFDSKFTLPENPNVEILLPEESINRAIARGKVLADQDIIKHNKKIEDKKIIDAQSLTQSTVLLRQNIDGLEIPEDSKLNLLRKIEQCINLASESQLDASSVSEIVSTNLLDSDRERDEPSVGNIDEALSSQREQAEDPLSPQENLSDITKDAVENSHSEPEEGLWSKEVRDRECNSSGNTDKSFV